MQHHAKPVGPGPQLYERWCVNCGNCGYWSGYRYHTKESAQRAADKHNKEGT